MKRAVNPWLLVAALWVVAGLNYLDRQVIFSVLPLLRDELKLRDVELGLLGTAFLWVYAVLSPVCGYLADRFGRRLVIGVSLFVWSVVTWATGLAQNLPQLLAARAVMGISEAFYLPAALALIAERHTATRSLATGLHTSGIYAGLILGGAGGWIGQRYGWRAAFTVLGAAGVIYSFVLLPALRGTPETVNQRRPAFLQSMREVLRIEGFWNMITVFMTSSAANWMLYTWLPLFLYERRGMTLAAAGFYTMYVHAASVGGILLGGWLADRWNARSPRGRVLTQAVGLLVNAPALLAVATVESHALLTVALVLFGLGKGFYDCNVMPVLSQYARADLRATAYGVFNLGGCLVGGFAAPVAGYLKSAIGIEGALRIAALVLLVSVVCLFRVRAGAAAEAVHAR